MNVFFIFLGLSMICLIGFFYSYYSSKTFKRKAIRVKSQVVAVQKQTSYDHNNNTESTNYFSTFRLTHRNQHFQHKSNIGSNPPRYKVGDQPEVWFLWDPSGNHKLKEIGWLSLNIYWALWLFAFFLFIVISYMGYSQEFLTP